MVMNIEQNVQGK